LPSLLLSFKRISDSEILIHGTLAPNEARALKLMEQHAGDCPKFGPAWRGDETIEQSIEVETIPAFEESAIEDWTGDMFGLEDDDEPDDADDDEEEDEETDDAESEG
jgi:hypothetical protein